jgi:hypothetical protein
VGGLRSDAFLEKRGWAVSKLGYGTRCCLSQAAPQPRSKSQARYHPLLTDPSLSVDVGAGEGHA